MRILFTTLIALTAPCAAADDTPKPRSGKRKPLDKAAVEKQARATVRAFLKVWNTADNARIRKVIHYPFVTVVPKGNIVIAGLPKDFADDFDQLRKKQGWHHSTFDAVKVVAVARGSAHVRVQFTRRRADGTPLRAGEVLYILTRKDGRWGIQVRSLLNLKVVRSNESRK